MRKPKDLPWAVEDKFLKLDGLSCNGIVYDDLTDTNTRKMFEENDAKYSCNNGLTSVIIGEDMYVSPYQDVREVLEAYGFEEGSFTVPFSIDIYEDYPYAMGTETILKVATYNPEDPVLAIEEAKEEIFKTEKFQKWNELVKLAFREMGYEVNLEQYHKYIYEQSYCGDKNKDRREKRNQGLRDMMKIYFPNDADLMNKIDACEGKEYAYAGRTR